MSNQISAQLSDKDLQEVLQAIATIQQKLPFLLKLSKGVKKSTSMLNDKRIPFATKALDYATRVTNLNPSPELLVEAQKDSDLFHKLQSVDRELQRLSEMVTDTRSWPVPNCTILPGLSIRCRRFRYHLGGPDHKVSLTI